VKRLKRIDDICLRTKCMYSFSDTETTDGKPIYDCELDIQQDNPWVSLRRLPLDCIFRVEHIMMQSAIQEKP